MLLLVLALGCSSRPGLFIGADAAVVPLLDDMVTFLDDPRAHLEATEDPATQPVGAALDAEHRSIGVVGDLDCGECYRIDVDDDGAVVVHGGLPLGVQYGLADALERVGYRFFHPQETVRPEGLDAFDVDGTGTLETPEQSVRGLSPHTLHPIEMTLDGWMPSEAGALRTRRVIDWLVKNRGNYLQNPALDNILADAATREAWALNTASMVNAAHARGVRVGAGLQLFGGSNLQLAFDLLEDASGSLDTRRARMEERLDVLTRGVPYDALNLSFGEFSQMPPETFLENVNLFLDVVKTRNPDTEVSAVIHVGDTPDTRTVYQGEDLLYYQLVRYADPRIVPYIHTVMYYNLFDDAGGAYHHEDFSEHRDYLYDELGAGEPVAYFPESAYWCAFDNTVPAYLPVYVYSRWRDMDQIRAEAPAPLDQHVLFSSGWEWGYWQNDVATLRMGWETPTDWRDLYAEMFAPWDQPDLAAALSDLAEAQHGALIGERLAPWMAGRDVLMESGRRLGILAQPDRPTWSEVAAMTADERAALRTSVLVPLAAHADTTQAILDRLDAVPGDDRWLAEIRDGVEVDVLRARFMVAMLTSMLAHADGDASSARESFSSAIMFKDAAQEVVHRRAAGFHDPDPSRLVERADNPTIYDFGYLHMSDTLCFWERDRVQVGRIVAGATGTDPGCAL